MNKPSTLPNQEFIHEQTQTCQMRDKGTKRAYPWEKDKGERKGRRRGGEQEEERRPGMDSGNAARRGRASGKGRRRKGEGVRGGCGGFIKPYPVPQR